MTSPAKLRQALQAHQLTNELLDFLRTKGGDYSPSVVMTALVATTVQLALVISQADDPKARLIEAISATCDQVAKHLPETYQ